ncbi:HAMP domain-containing protein [Massilia sp. B-10]|nr:HAMP domain-containing protein [Massilia sp. B-10]
MVLASRFKGSIADPVTKLINAAQKVSASQNYNLRISHERTDELGTLIDSFNDMLAQIEGRGAALTHHRDELERQVSVRTEQLEKAKNAAEAASRAKSAFLATMSHEIRTPMNGVLGMTEMLLSTSLTETQRNFTRLVKRSGEHLLVIINDILDFSKIEAGKLSIEYINFNLWDLLDDINNIYSPQAHAKGIALDFDIANDIPIAICGDPNRLRQIMANLLGNAIKFTDRGQILAKVQVTGEDGPTVSLRFRSARHRHRRLATTRSRIFEAFSQADNSTTRKYGGTGLGLAISRQLVELMGGKIGVENALTQGSIFWFTVSFDKRRVETDEPGMSLKAIEGLRVLVVDESEESRRVLEQQLAAWQVASESARSAVDAVERLTAAARSGKPYDVAIIDMDLKRTSGLSLAAAIKGDPNTAATRLLLVSDNRLAADPVQRREAERGVPADQACAQRMICSNAS